MELTKDTILHAWRDEEFMNSLSPEERRAIPARPTAEDGTALSDAQLEEAAGGISPVTAALIVGGSALGGAGVAYGGMEIID